LKSAATLGKRNTKRSALRHTHSDTERNIAEGNPQAAADSNAYRNSNSDHFSSGLMRWCVH